MENINGKSRASFPWTFSCVTMGLAVSVSLCFAQGNRDASRELQRVQEVQRLLGPCDSLDPKVCFDIYQRRMGEFGQAMFGKVPFPLSPKEWKEWQEGTRIK